MIAMIVFAKREARGYPPPPYIPTCAMMEQLPMQQKTDADQFSANTKFHVFVKRGN